ncbi:hypothetical protein B0H19DRAFT_1057161 [Mycena capillaripes]|nr:hypothetical protein B0H19DRAFT_1080223 [Mycena capillaripes]KAJ6594955.1 hypothetical protein B0H19DRAFT_1057161 [Mycena capillaripes]
MQAMREDLAPPKDDHFTLAQLKDSDGSDPSKPIYVCIKVIQDFRGQRWVEGVQMSSLKEEHAIPCYSELNETDRKVLDEWYGFSRSDTQGTSKDHVGDHTFPGGALG